MTKKTFKTFLREVRVYALIRIWDMTIGKKGDYVENYISNSKNCKLVMAYFVVFYYFFY